jgi:hypothetical protein
MVNGTINDQFNVPKARANLWTERRERSHAIKAVDATAGNQRRHRNPVDAEAAECVPFAPVRIIRAPA